MLEIEVVPAQPGVTLVVLKGRMNTGSRMMEIESRLQSSAEAESSALLLDMAGVEYIDSTGLGALMMLFGKMKTLRGRFGLIAPNHAVMHVLELTCTDKVLNIYPDRESALQA